ncbi:hypothetical protein [Candidatus Binatus sp.]|uniref:hypothetical protein n=1 Tax=Candidatus Binatus sp. TaxID=2811406 RepID=UPI003C8FB3C1
MNRATLKLPQLRAYSGIDPTTERCRRSVIAPSRSALPSRRFLIAAHNLSVADSYWRKLQRE